MSAILESVARFRRELLANEREAAGAMVQAYGQAWMRIRGELDTLLASIEEARKNGETVGRTWLLRRDRLKSLLSQVEREIGYFARNTEARIRQQQQQAIEAASRQARQLVIEGMGDGPSGIVVQWNRVPTEALTDLVGTLQNGSPLSDLLDELGGEAATGVQRELITGLAAGKGSREIARAIRGAMGMELTRALRISRTEVLRSYRTSAVRNYQQNSDVVSGWIWLASLSGRSCAACLSMHGTVHPLEEPFGSHPNCRCVPVPKTRSWKELGFEGMEETALEVEPGVVWLGRQKPETQDAVLGSAAAGEAYRAGRVQLQDFVIRRESKEWGVSRSAGSLQQALNRAQERTPQTGAGVKRNYQATEKERQDYIEQLKANPRRSFDLARRLERAEQTKQDFPDTTLSIEELVALEHYTGNGYRDINRVLRKDREHVRDVVALWNQGLPASSPIRITERGVVLEARNDARMLLSALNRLPAYEGDTFRTAQLGEAALARYQAGETVTEEFFLSTKQTGFWKESANTRFVIQSKTGRRIRDFSALPDEEEVLFAPSGRFLVLDVETRDGKTWVYLKEVVE